MAKIIKLSSKDKEEIVKLYIESDLSVYDIAKEYQVERTSIIYHLRKFFKTKKISQFRTKPIRRKVNLTRHISKKKKQSIVHKSIITDNIKTNVNKKYQDYINSAKKKMKENRKTCEHKYWIKRCSVCNEILECEKQIVVNEPEIKYNKSRQFSTKRNQIE